MYVCVSGSDRERERDRDRDTEKEGGTPFTSLSGRFFLNATLK